MPENVEIATVRLLSMISWIGEHPGVGVEELGEHFGRTRRQVERDVELLGLQGDSLPGNSFEIDWNLYEREGRLRMRTTMGVDLPPRLTRTEATAVLVGLRAIAPVLDEDLRSHLPHAALAVSAMSPGGPAPRVLSVSGESAHDPRLDLVREALSGHRQVSFTYTKADSTTSRRLVDPWSLRLGREGWVLSGWCHSSQDRRAFRLDRMEDVHVEDSPLDHVDDGTDAPRAPEVTLRVTRSALWVVDDLGARVLHEDPESITVAVPVWDRRWLVALLVDLAPNLLGCDDAAALEAMGRRARRALVEWGERP